MGDIDTWFVDSEVKGLRFRVDVDPDYDASPDQYDCYDEKDVAAWKRDEWRFVTVFVTPEYKGTLIEPCKDVLGSVDWGRVPGALVQDLGRESFNDHPLKEMTTQSLENVREATFSYGPDHGWIDARPQVVWLILGDLHELKQLLDA